MIEINLDNLESKAIDVVAKISPWLAPLPTSYLIGQSVIDHLHWPIAIGITAAAAIESLGLASTSTALTLWQYNGARRKVDERAPFELAAGLVGLYFCTAVGLTVALDVIEGLSQYATIVFPLLSLTGVSVLALRSDHKRRLEAIATEKAERKAEKAAERLAKIQHSEMGDTGNRKSEIDQSGNLDAANQQRKAKREAQQAKLLEVYRSNPDVSIVDAAKSIGVSKSTGYDYTAELQTSGALHRNGNGWEVQQ